MRLPHTRTQRLLAMEEIASALHAMCQPLTALQCQLELGQMNEDAASRMALLNGKSAVWTERLFEGCLRECARLNTIVTTMRMIVQRAADEEQVRKG